MSEPLITEDTIGDACREVGSKTVFSLLREQFRKEWMPELRQAVQAAREEGRRQQKCRREFWDRFTSVCIALGILATVAVVALLIGYFVRRNDLYNQNQTLACATGNTGACMDAVRRQEKEMDGNGADRARSLRAIYRQRTGKELPCTVCGRGD